MSKATIEFPNVSCLGLWRAEISGQLSDGMWENTAPYDHWKFWCNLESKVGGCRVDMNGTFVPYNQKVGYNLAGLYEYVGDRMVQYGRMGRALQSLGILDPSRGVVEAGEYMAAMTYAEWLKAKELDGFKESWVTEKMKEVTPAIAAAFFSTRYEMKDLRKDVALIKAAMKTVKR